MQLRLKPGSAPQGQRHRRIRLGRNLHPAPLLAGGADFLTMITAQAQLNTALQALYYYAWTNQTAASANTSSNTITAQNTLIAAINSASIFHITLAPGTASGSSSNLFYACVNSTHLPRDHLRPAALCHLTCLNLPKRPDLGRIRAIHRQHERDLAVSLAAKTQKPVSAQRHRLGADLRKDFFL